MKASALIVELLLSYGSRALLCCQAGGCKGAPPVRPPQGRVMSARQACDLCAPAQPDPPLLCRACTVNSVPAFWAKPHHLHRAAGVCIERSGRSGGGPRSVRSALSIQLCSSRRKRCFAQEEEGGLYTPLSLPWRTSNPGSHRCSAAVHRARCVTHCQADQSALLSQCESCQYPACQEMCTACPGLRTLCGTLHNPPECTLPTRGASLRIFKIGSVHRLAAGDWSIGVTLLCDGRPFSILS